MISVSGAYLAMEAKNIGTWPKALFSILPFYWPNGVDATGTFVNAAYVAPDRIQLDNGAVSGSWVSAPIASNIQLAGSPAVMSWIQNSPGYDTVISWRQGNSLAELAAAAWTAITSPTSATVPAYYQFRAVWTGQRCWASDSGATDDGSFAYAEDSPGNLDGYQGFAVDSLTSGDVYTYIRQLLITGEYPILHDIEAAGSLSLQVPKQFGELVAGTHSGLLLNNRQRDVNGSPAPAYSPNKGSFILATDQNWYGKQLKVQVGFYDPPSDDWELFTAWLGKITKWGPVMRQVDQSGAPQPNTCEIDARDWITELLTQRIAMPAADGTPQPLTFGEFLVAGVPVVGWSPVPPLKTATFEGDNFNKLDHLVISSGASASLITPGLTGQYALRTAVTGANQEASGQLVMPMAGEIFVSGNLRFQAVPGTIAAANFTFLEILEATGAVDYVVTVDAAGLVVTSGEQSKFNILAYVGMKIPFALWLRPATNGFAKLWLNGDEVLSYSADLSSENPLSVKFGAITGAVAESWTMDFDDIELKAKYFENAFQAFGGPFADITTVYADNIAQPDSQTIINPSPPPATFTQTLTRHPEYGLVQFSSTDPAFKPSNTILFRVVMNAGGMHPVDVITALLTQAGAAAFIDTANFAAAKAATPGDLIHARFTGKEEKKFQSGLPDSIGEGTTVGDAVKEIVSRCLYFFFIDHGVIRLVPYTGIPPVSPILAITDSDTWECDQTIDMDILTTNVSIKYGWYDRNPNLFYIAGDPLASGNAAQLDMTWSSPVATESYDMAKAKADLLLKFLYAQERIDPVNMSLKGMRLELMDPVSLNDILLHDAPRDYWVTRKQIDLDSPQSGGSGQRQTVLQLMRFLGE